MLAKGSFGGLFAFETEPHPVTIGAGVVKRSPFMPPTFGGHILNNLCYEKTFNFGPCAGGMLRRVVQ